MVDTRVEPALNVKKLLTSYSPIRSKKQLNSVIKKRRKRGKERKSTSELAPLGSPADTAAWFKRHNFRHLLHLFDKYNCNDLLNLSLEDVITKCGHVQGMRLFYKIHKKKPSKLMYFTLRNQTTPFYDITWKPIVFTSLTTDNLLESLKQHFDLNHETFSYSLVINERDNDVMIDNEYLSGHISDKSMFFVDIQKDTTARSYQLRLTKFYS